MLQHGMPRELHCDSTTANQNDTQALCCSILERCGEVQNRMMVSNGDDVGVERLGQTPRHCSAGHQQPAEPNL
jgi:hypothetical protein